MGVGLMGGAITESPIQTLSPRPCTLNPKP